MGTKIKYMGSAHTRKLPKGTDFGGQLADPTEKVVVFNRDNNWVVDADEAGLSKEAVELLVEGADFADVSDQKRVEPNRHQQVFMGMVGPSAKSDDDGDADADAGVDNAEESGEAVSTAASVTESPSGATTTTTGGSTAKTTAKK